MQVADIGVQCGREVADPSRRPHDSIGASRRRAGVEHTNTIHDVIAEPIGHNQGYLMSRSGECPTHLVVHADITAGVGGSQVRDAEPGHGPTDATLRPEVLP